MLLHDYMRAQIFIFILRAVLFVGIGVVLHQTQTTASYQIAQGCGSRCW
jgi:hypothetical protein